MIKKMLFIFCMLIALFFLYNCDDAAPEDSLTESTTETPESTEPPGSTDAYGLVIVPATIGYYMGWDGTDVTDGYDNEDPIHTVELAEFYISKYEVTFALWNEVKSWAENNGYLFDNDGWQGGSTEDDYPYGYTDQHPVTSISWRDCIAWCNAYSEKEGITPVYFTNDSKNFYYKNSNNGIEINNDCVDWNGNGFRLPTEAEWEHAARYIDVINVSSGAYHSGYNLESNIELCAWYSGNTTSSTHPVGQKESNSLGLYDMTGNVWEWCWDEYADYSEDFSENPRGPNTTIPSANGYYYRVHRGGSWHLDAVYCRTTSRGFSGRGSTSTEIYTGFRVARIE